MLSPKSSSTGEFFCYRKPQADSDSWAAPSSGLRAILTQQLRFKVASGGVFLGDGGFVCYRLLPMEQPTAPSSEVPPARRVIGRTVRVVVGAVLLYLFVGLIRQAPQILAARRGWSVPKRSWWAGALDS